MPKLILAFLAVLWWTPTLHSQEFTRQAVLVVPFRADTSRTTTSMLAKIGRDVADAVRDRTAKLVNGRDAQVLAGFWYDNLLQRSSYNRTLLLTDNELRTVTYQVRADEIVQGSVRRVDGDLVVHATLKLLRSWEMPQPLPTVRGATPTAIGEQLAREIAKARAQMTPLRRCENALYRGDRGTAAREAERAIRAYAQAVPARDCLLAALLDGRTGADSVRRVADDILMLDSTNIFANVVRADAYETLGQRSEAVAQWQRVHALRGDSLPLGVRSVEGLLRLQQPALALPMVRTLREQFTSAELRRLEFRALTSLARWPEAARLGDTLEVEDATFQGDSNYAVRYVEALRQTADTLAAIELSARNVRRFGRDSRLYVQYLQLLNSEQPAALPRGLERFPEVAELRLLAATAARRAGDRGGAIRNLRAAVQRDTTRVASYLQLADLYLDVGESDSAITMLTRAPRGGAEVETVRAYTIARGLMLYRASVDSALPVQHRALRWLMLADSLASREDSRATLAAASLQVARAHLVIASRTRSCSETQAADTTLAPVPALLGAGTGASLGEITAAHQAMRQAVDDALPLLCRPLTAP
jgi:predicted Zn-dependent protease